jgi:hypothetical protein
VLDGRAGEIRIVWEEIKGGRMATPSQTRIPPKCGVVDWRVNLCPSCLDFLPLVVCEGYLRPNRTPNR